VAVTRRRGAPPSQAVDHLAGEDAASELALAAAPQEDRDATIAKDAGQSVNLEAFCRRSANRSSNDSSMLVSFDLWRRTNGTPEEYPFRGKKSSLF